jgi:3-hydroxybutyryl-CoA dehydrogenase
MKLSDIKSIGVLGAGVMGGGISQSAIQAGYNIICRDLNDEILAKTKDTIINGRFGFKGGVERGKITQEAMDAAVARLTLTTKVEDLKDCDLIIEAIGGGDTGRLEDKPLKLRVFTELDNIVKKEAVFASNTSTFTIADLAAVTNRKEHFIGLHFFSPANIMKLAEVIYTADTTEDTIVLIEELARSWGKTPIRVKDVPGDTGFVGNRVMGAARREAMKVVEEGIATAADVNTAMMLGFNWPVGPLPLGGPSARSGWQ